LIDWEAMSFFDKKRIIILAPHADDAEYGCGGTISKICKGADLFYVVFSFAAKSLIDGFSKEDVKAEMLQASSVLGVKRGNIISKDYEVREFPRDRQMILEDLVDIKKEIKPDIVFMPSTFDTHQDHKVVCEEGFRAFKGMTIFGYECISNNREFRPGLYVNLKEEDIDKKKRAIECYKSQVIKKKNSVNFVQSLAEVRGHQVDSKYAEAFEVIRLIL